MTAEQLHDQLDALYAEARASRGTPLFYKAVEELHSARSTALSALEAEQYAFDHPVHDGTAELPRGSYK